MDNSLKLLDVLSELIYMRDLDTHELVYINEPGAKLFGVPKGGNGRTCYEVLQGRTEPCPFCPFPYLSAEKTYTWEYQNPQVNRHYLLKDRLIEFEGRLVHMEIAFDITEQKYQQKQLEQFSDINDIVVQCAKELYRSNEFEEKIEEIIRIVGTSLKAERAYVFRIKGEEMFNTHEWCADGIEPMIDSLQHMPITLLDRWMESFQQNECVIIDDLAAVQEHFAEEYDVLAAQGIHSLLAAPLWAEGMLIGYIGIDNPPAEKIHWAPMLFDTLSYFLVSSMRSYEYGVQLQKLSYYDSLTGAQNRNRYMEKLEQLEQATCKNIGVLYIDLNGLKSINDTLGHDRGDEALVQTEQEIAACFPCNCVYRIGGDEFVVIAYPIEESDFFLRVRKLKQQFAENGTLKIAVGHRWAEETESIGALIAQADALMYADKKAFYRENPVPENGRHGNEAVLKFTDPNELRALLKEGRFRLYLQPKNNLKTRELIGAEALVRYVDEYGKMIPPIEFINMLEYVQLIHLVDFYMTEKTCHFLQQLHESGGRMIPISVNYSRYTLSQPNFVQHLNQIMERFHLEKKWLQLEITESGDAEISEDTMHVLQQLKQEGYTICMDDFGVKYANLLLFSMVDFDVLKLDKELLRTIEENSKTRSLIRSIAELCLEMNIELVVEGVETEQERTTLLALRGSFAQGYLFDKPIPEQDFRKKYLQ